MPLAVLAFAGAVTMIPGLHIYRDIGRRGALSRARVRDNGSCLHGPNAQLRRAILSRRIRIDPWSSPRRPNRAGSSRWPDELITVDIRHATLGLQEREHRPRMARLVLHEDPTLVGVEIGHCIRGARGINAQILAVNRAQLVDDERHETGFAIFDRPSDERISLCHVPVIHVRTAPARRFTALGSQDFVLVPHESVANALCRSRLLQPIAVRAG